MKTRLAAVLSATVLLGCSDRDVDASGDGDQAAMGEACSSFPDQDNPVCETGLACEPTGEPGEQAFLCARRIELRGRVNDALDGEPIADALVTALTEDGSPAGDVARTDLAGNYVLEVSARRTVDGDLAEVVRWTLFATAAEYQPFPAGVRPSIPVDSTDLAAPSPDDQATGGEAGTDAASIENATTQVTLIPLPAAESGGRTVSGHIGRSAALDDAPPFAGAGALVVAEGVTPARYAIADASGAYEIFNIPAGAARLVAYKRGLSAEAVDVPSDATDDVDLPIDAAAGDALPAVNGSVSIVNAPGGATTSVVLVPASVYNDALERGPVPFGLRAPGQPAAPSVSGAFAIDGVPPGTYKVLAAFENDELVRDPDTSISGTDIVEITVADAPVDTGTGFKVTEGLAVVSPGADGPESISGAPTFVFADDSSEDRYEVIVYDAFGELIWSADDVPSVSGSDTVEVPYAGPALQAGMYYQFRATSWRDRPNGSTAISRTEDLRGVFVGSP